MSDKDALIAMDAENRLRRDISPYERALSYSRWLRAGHFKHQDEIARTLKISASQVSRVLRLAQLPAIVVEAFPNPTEIREEWGLSLVSKLEEPGTKKALLETARSIVTKSERHPAKVIYKRLVAAAVKGKKLKPPLHDVVVRGEGGAALFRVRHQRDAIALLLPVASVGERTMREICDAISGILQAATVQVGDSIMNGQPKPNGKRVHRGADSGDLAVV